MASAAAMIGKVEAGDDIAGVTNGQFSLIDILDHCLSQTGPASVCIATWTMGVYDAERAYRFVADDRIKNIRFVVDPSMFTRRAELASVLVRGFGVEAFLAVNSHAKFLTVRGSDLAICVRTSMNLNENNRLETFDLSADVAMVAAFEGLVDRIWRQVDEKNKSQSRAIFEGLLDAQPVKSPVRRNPFRAD